MKSCSVCRKEVDTENAPILAMGGFGNPRYLCEECSLDIENALYGKEIEKIEKSMKSLSEKLSSDSSDDEVTLEAVKDLFSKAGERARKIKEGNYDFSLDLNEEESEFDEIPEELLETEEDKARDIKDSETAKKLDKIFNLITLLVFAAAIVFFIISVIR